MKKGVAKYWRLLFCIKMKKIVNKTRKEWYNSIWKLNGGEMKWRI